MDDMFEGLTFECGGCGKEIECTGEVTICPHCNTSNMISEEGLDELEEMFSELSLLPPVIPTDYTDYTYITSKIESIKKEIELYKTHELIGQINIIHEEQQENGYSYITDEIDEIIANFEIYGYIDDRGMDVLKGSFIVCYLFEGEALNKKEEAC
jgi:hypothetical protein